MSTQRVKETFISLFTVDQETGQVIYAGKDFQSLADLEKYAIDKGMGNYIHLEMHVIKEVKISVVSEPIKALPIAPSLDAPGAKTKK